MSRMHTASSVDCAGPAGTLLLAYSLYTYFVLPPLHNFRPGAECVKPLFDAVALLLSNLLKINAKRRSAISP